MTPEEMIRFCFMLAREGECEPITRAVPDISSEDWMKLEQFVVHKGFAPILYDRIMQNHYVSILPTGVTDALRQAYHHNAARNLYAVKQLSEILTTLENQSIPVIVLKGAYYGFSVYKNAACRTMSDLDLLFRKENITESVALLETLGYRLYGAPWVGPRHHLPPLFKKGFPFTVEVHSRLATLARTTTLTPELIWEEAHPGSLFGHPIRVLSPALALFYVCMHSAYQHVFANASLAIVDIDTLFRYYEQEINWDTFWDFADSEHCRPGVAYLLGLSVHLLSTPFPDMVIEKISSVDFPKDIKESVYEVMLAGEQLPDTPPEGIFNIAKWWMNKMRKFADAVLHAHEKRIDNTQTSKRQAGDSIRRSGYLFKDYLSALLNLPRINRDQQKMRTNRRLRSWLEIP
jgi:hypothetical protein